VTEFGYLNFSGTTLNLTYEDMSVTIDATASESTQATFTPGLDLIPDGKSVGDEWTVDSSMTASGTVTGSVDVTGISDTYQEQFFNLTKTMGITGFPIDLTQISTPSGSSIAYHNGAFGPYTTQMGGDLSYTRNKIVPDATGTSVMTICIAETSSTTGQTSFFVDPSNHHLLATETPVDVGNNVQIIFSMHAVTTTAAESTISTVTNQVSDRTSAEEIFNPGSSNGSGDNTMLYVLAIVAAIVVVLVVVFLMMRRKK
jgi:hypothetical protein